MLLHATELDRGLVYWTGHVSLDPSDGFFFEMPGVSFSVSVVGCTDVQAYMHGGNGFFRVCVFRVDSFTPQSSDDFRVEHDGLEWLSLAKDLDPESQYLIRVLKKTEGNVRTLWSAFRPVNLRFLRINDGSFCPIDGKKEFSPSGWLEIIGDSDACGFGVDGQVSSTSNLLSMDPEMQDVTKAWGFELARELGLGPVGACVVAGSGLGLTRNAPFCGRDTIPVLWHRLLRECREFTEPPRAVVLLLGGNDFCMNFNVEESSFVETMQQFIRSMKRYRGNEVPIFVFQCSASCASSAGDPDSHPENDESAIQTSRKLEKLSLMAIQGLHGVPNVHFRLLKSKLILEEDFAIMMHWSPSGHKKIAAEMACFMRERGFLG